MMAIINCDIGTIQNYVTLIKDIITGVSALIVAIVAVKGLQTWKKQLKWKTEYELAKRLMGATYKVRQALALVRCPVKYVGEVSQAMKEANIEGELIDNQARRFRNEAADYENRMQKVKEAFDDLESVLLEAEAIWGQDVRENIKPLQQCITTLAVNIYKHFEIKEGLSDDYNAEEKKNIDSIIFDWFGNPNNNSFSNEINAALGKITNFLNPHLKIEK